MKMYSALLMLLMTSLASVASSADDASWSCDFDNGACGMTLSQPRESTYPWRIGFANQSNWLGGPAIDSANSTQGIWLTVLG